MAIVLERGGRSLAATAVEALCDWAPQHSPVTSVHAGDIGWHLRLDDADLADTIVVARDGSEVVAVALAESDALRATARPDHSDDTSLAAALGELAQSIASGSFYCDTPPHTALHAWLASAGWTLDPEAWAAFYRPLSDADCDLGAGLAHAVDTDDDIRDRVAVQFAAFKRSTFTVARWHQMAAAPGYRRDLDLLRRDGDGIPVAAATTWTADPDGSASSSRSAPIVTMSATATVRLSRWRRSARSPAQAPAASPSRRPCRIRRRCARTNGAVCTPSPVFTRCGILRPIHETLSSLCR